VADQWAGALYLAPVVVAAVVAWAVTRPGRKKATTAHESDTSLAPVIPLPRPTATPYDGIERRTGSRRPVPANIHPTLFHAALSSHLSAVSRPARGAAASAANAASMAAFQSARLVSSRRPTRIPRRPSHQCPRKP
jgi:hypothetical protein